MDVSADGQNVACALANMAVQVFKMPLTGKGWACTGTNTITGAASITSLTKNWDSLDLLMLKKLWVLENFMNIGLQSNVSLYLVKGQTPRHGISVQNYRTKTGQDFKNWIVLLTKLIGHARFI